MLATGRSKDKLQADLVRQLDTLLNEQFIYVGHGTRVLEPVTEKTDSNALDELRDLVNYERGLFARGLGEPRHSN